jgi:hypothetical protein
MKLGSIVLAFRAWAGSRGADGDQHPFTGGDDGRDEPVVRGDQGVVLPDRDGALLVLVQHRAPAVAEGVVADVEAADPDPVPAGVALTAQEALVARLARYSNAAMNSGRQSG